MSAVLNNDIFLLIVAILAADSASHTHQDRKVYDYITEKWKVENKAKDALLALRCTCHFLAISITPYLISQITIDKIDKDGARRLRGIQKSASIPSVVKTYTLKPAIVHTAPGQ